MVLGGRASDACCYLYFLFSLKVIRAVYYCSMITVYIPPTKAMLSFVYRSFISTQVEPAPARRPAVEPSLVLCKCFYFCSV